MPTEAPWDRRDVTAVETHPLRLGSTATQVERRDDGTMVMRLLEKLEPYPARLTERLLYWAQRTPDAIFLAQRSSSGAWETLTFSRMLQRVLCVAQALLDRALSVDAPVMILSENDIDNATLALACLHAGIPYTPVTPAYSLLSQDFAKLRHQIELCRPGLIFAASGTRYEKAACAAFPDIEFVVSDQPPVSRPATLFRDLLATRVTSAVQEAFDRLDANTIGKVMFTSGTMGKPKGVMFSQAMLCSNRQQVVQHLAFLDEGPTVQVDWLPWHHTFGGTQNFGIALFGGGALYIDPGRPTPEGIATTVASLTEVAPSFYQGTPQAFAMLLPHLRRNEALRRNFFSRLRLIYYGGAVMPEHVWDGLDRLAVETTGKRVLILSGLGSTETGPVPMGGLQDPHRQPVVGIPVPGCELKIAPVDNKLEIRVRGPNVTPGYWKDPELTRSAFDEEGFFRMGDAVTFIDPRQPELGLRFDGRIGENFKLLSGVWVNVAECRERLISACAPYLRDAVIAGHDRESVAALLFPDADRLRDHLGDATDRADADLLADPRIHLLFQERLDRLAATAPPSSRIVRAVLESEPPSLDTGELTAKLSISQTVVLNRRAAAVADLYSDIPPDRVIHIGAVSRFQRKP